MKKVFGLVILLVSKGFALSISPVDLEIDWKKGQGYYTLTNDANSQKIISITGKTRDIDLEGNNIYNPTKDLIIYPKQVVLKPKEKRLIRVIWKAKKPLDAEKAFRIVFAEQNVDIDFGEEDLGKNERRAGISFGIRFEGTVFVQPKKVKTGKVKVVNFEKRKIEGEDYFVVTLQNSSNIHKVIATKDMELEVLASAKEAKEEDWRLVSESVLEKHLGTAFVFLQNGKREIRIPCNEKSIPDDVFGVRITE